MENKDNNKTIKNVILIVLALITIACIVIGSYRFTKSAKNSLSKAFKELGMAINLSDDDEKIYLGSNLDTNLEAFSELQIDAKVMSVTIMNGPNYSLKCNYNKEKAKPKYMVENGVLRIRQDNFKSNTGNLKCDLVITVPRSIKIDDVDINLNVGEISLEGFNCDNLNVTNNVGEIEIRDINFEQVKAHANVGEISIRTMSPVDEYEIEAQTNVGEVNVNGKNHKREYSQKGVIAKKISAKTNVGEVRIY